MKMRRMGRQNEGDTDEEEAARLTRQNMSTYGRLLQYVRPYKLWMMVSIIALLFSVALGLILPLVVRNLVDLILADQSLPRLNQLALGLFVVFILQAIFSFINQLSLAYVGENAVADIRMQVYAHIQTLSLRYFTDHRTGEIMSRITNDVSQLQAAITEDVLALLRQVLTLCGAIILLFWLDWRLTLIILLGVPFITLTSLPYIFNVIDGHLKRHGNRQGFIEKMFQQIKTQLKQTQVASVRAMDNSNPFVFFCDHTQINHPNISQTSSYQQA
ncbi:MAG: ABC transporter transmembrane domain-containing protein [Chloroflexi bacterium]|nr:ABC transporter transmembrane domain-containing protein [Chloroflexota bacterium]